MAGTQTEPPTQALSADLPLSLGHVLRTDTLDLSPTPESSPNTVSPRPPCRRPDTPSLHLLGDLPTLPFSAPSQHQSSP